MEKAKYIDPTIGTVGEADVGHGGGKTHPGACTPGGMVQLSPDTITGGDNGTGYNYFHIRPLRGLYHISRILLKR